MEVMKTINNKAV